MRIAIIPEPCFNGPATQLECVDTQVQLGVGLDTECRLLNAKNDIVSARQRAQLKPEQYEAWTGSDEYVCECIARNLGLTPATQPAPA